jgi:3D (Asp-Asp-Asp) domain-containing protein
MRLSRSIRRKLLATALTAAGFVLLYEATVMDSRTAADGMPLGKAVAAPVAGARVGFIATAYCRGETTASGVTVQAGIAAGDPDILPEGSVIQVEGAPDPYQGIYTVMDTGPKVQGRHIDLYMWSCTEARVFGRRPVTVTVLRLGWNPKNTAPPIKAIK